MQQLDTQQVKRVLKKEKFFEKTRSWKLSNYHESTNIPNIAVVMLTMSSSYFNMKTTAEWNTCHIAVLDLSSCEMKSGCERVVMVWSSVMRCVILGKVLYWSFFFHIKHEWEGCEVFRWANFKILLTRR